MKPVLFFTLFLWSFTFQSVAQKEIDYTLRYHEGVRWVTGEFSGGDIVLRLEHYEIKGDSTIGTKKYNKLYWNKHPIALLRNEEGAIYLHFIKDESELPGELWGIPHWGTLHEDFLLCTYTNHWEPETEIRYTSLRNYYKELYKDSVQTAYVDTIQFVNGKYYKKYKDWVYGFGTYEKGPLGSLIPEFPWEGGFYIVELYDNEELIFRSKNATNGLPEVEDSHSIRTLYSPKDKLLIIDSALSEETYTVELFRVDGTKALTFCGASYSLSGLPQGIYLVRISTANKCLYTSKIRIE